MTRIICTALITAFIASCSKGSDSLTFDTEIEIAGAGERLCILKENIGLVGNITCYTMAGDTLLAAVDGKNAFLYNIVTGEQKCQLGSNGRATRETITPTMIGIYSDKIFVWCSSLLKLVEFDLDGNYIAEYKGFKNAARHFTVDGSNGVVYMYTSGIAQGNQTTDIIQAYDMRTGQISDKFGIRSGEDEVMSIMQNSGGICYDRGRLLYVNPAHPDIYVKDEGELEKHYKISDYDFIEETVEDSKTITGDRNRSVWFAFAGEHSFTTGIYADDKNIYEVVVAGKKNYDNNNVFVDNGNSHNKIYVFDKEMKPVKSVGITNLSLTSMIIHNGDVHYVYDEVTDTDRILTLKRIRL